jgi:hypothetical protein
VPQAKVYLEAIVTDAGDVKAAPKIEVSWSE